MSRRPPKKADWMKRADKLFSKMIRDRDGACVACGSTEFLQCAHIISRSYKSIRVNPDNAVALCRSCHTFWTHRPIEWRQYVEGMFPGRWTVLEELALQHERVDWKGEVGRLKGDQ
jgi:5-methylcytosine-specific restriction endonuclease McrA